ncbi:MAG: hypothetical protein ACTSRT_19970 [Promethearchaeota archaeon]
MIEKVVVDAQVLFYFHYNYQKIPIMLQHLKKKIAELLWKLRKAGKTNEFKEALSRWESSENIIIEDFNLKILKSMIKNVKSYELHDEIIAMICKMHETNIIYSTDKKFKEIFNLELRSWK